MTFAAGYGKIGVQNKKKVVKTMKCKKGYEIEVCECTAGCYMGTVDPDDGFPNCRITRYYNTPEEAAAALKRGEIRICIENEFCNKGRGCT